ncbi:MAG: sodium-dependent bicarbonate transport family permease [Phycisphaerae bacterium]|nr:sodium-dependent bicarbonate transport family permease [Phycisphaerae bacterium]
MTGTPDLSSGLSSVTNVLGASPPVLFFFLGMFATLARSTLAIPKAVTKLLSLYLLWSIGFQGGVKLVHGGLGSDALAALGIAVALACLTPVAVFFLLRRWIAAPDAAAVAASYGSISAVTFVTACTVLTTQGIAYGGHMVACMALMESPAIVIAVLLLNSCARDERVGRTAWGKLLHEALLNGPVLLLLGSMVIGMVTGERGYQAFKPLCTDLFSGVLVFFLLDLGLLAARRLGDLRRAGARLIAFGLVAPPIGAAVALVAAWAAGLRVGDGVLLMVLAGSASYIAVPAAVRLVIPRANPGIFIPLALAVTFPFNIGVGIPLYLFAAARTLQP